MKENWKLIGVGIVAVVMIAFMNNKLMQENENKLKFLPC